LGGEISLALLDDAEMTRMNRRYLGVDGPTDVIAFALGEEFDPLGDVYVGAEQAASQASERGITLEEELVRLTVHGTLHVLGYDHPEGCEGGSEMFRIQEQLVTQVMAERGAPSDRSVQVSGSPNRPPSPAPDMPAGE